jgi:hypothetical protein
MDELEKSDRLIVPVKLANKAGQPAAESVEGRGLAKGNRPSIRTHSGHCTGSHAIFRWEGATGRTRRERRRHSAPTGLSFVPKAGARCGLRWESWYQLVGESPAWPKSSRQASSEFCVRRGNAGYEA